MSISYLRDQQSLIDHDYTIGKETLRHCVDRNAFLVGNRIFSCRLEKRHQVRLTPQKVSRKVTRFSPFDDQWGNAEQNRLTIALLRDTENTIPSKRSQQ